MISKKTLQVRLDRHHYRFESIEEEQKNLREYISSKMEWLEERLRGLENHLGIKWMNEQHTIKGYFKKDKIKK